MITQTPRVQFIDVLRGFALFGILFVNAIDLSWAGMGWAQLHDRALPHDPLRDLMDVTVQTRFVPVFTVLFGTSMVFVIDGARARAARPWLVVVRRFAALAVIGALLAVIYPGNVLYEYAAAALVVSWIVVFLPRWVVLTLGVVLTVGAYAATGGGLAATPGLMLLGAGMARYDVPRALGRAGLAVAIVFGLAIVVAVPLVCWQLAADVGDPRFSTLGGTAGGVTAVAYVTGLSLLWRTPLRRPLTTVFEPLGRMALTNYVSAAVAVVVVAQVFQFSMSTTIAPVLLTALVLIGVQSACSRWWLARFTYGPLEWVWRSATWLQVPQWRRSG